MRTRSIPGITTYEMVDEAGNVHHVRCDWETEQMLSLSGDWVPIGPRKEKYTLLTNDRVLKEVGDGSLVDEATGATYRKAPRRL